MTLINYNYIMLKSFKGTSSKVVSILNLILTFNKVNLTKIVKGRKTTKHDFTPVEYYPIKQLFTDRKYQRLISQSFINKQGNFNPLLARPLVVAKRPNGQLVIIDGQHTASLAAIYLEGDGEQVVPCQVAIRHKLGTSTEDCIKIESKFFDDLNYLRNNANAVARLRAAIAAGTKWATDLESTFNNMNVHVEGIGDPDGHEVYGYTKLRTCVSKYGQPTTKEAVEHYARIISKTKQKEWKKPLQAGLILGLAAAINFKETSWKTECDGKREFTRFLETYLTGTKREKFSPKYWTEKTSGVMDVLILEKFINLFNQLESIKSDKIGDRFTKWKETEIHKLDYDSSSSGDNTLDVFFDEDNDG